jgi:hypothetical protein
MAKSQMYSIDDIGCYVDEARGIYMIDRIYDIAVEHGFSDSDADKILEGESPENGEIQTTSEDNTLAGWEFSGELEDQIDEFMNDNFEVEGAHWGRSEQGDWGLWTDDESEE